MLTDKKDLAARIAHLNTKQDTGLALVVAGGNERPRCNKNKPHVKTRLRKWLSILQRGVKEVAATTNGGCNKDNINDNEESDIA